MDVQYPEIGIPNVVVEDAVVWTCSNGHDQVIEVVDPDAMRRRLAESIVMKPGVLHGGELRFLRRYLEYPAKSFAQLIGITPVHLSRSENGPAISRTLDRLARLLLVQSEAEQGRRFPHDIIEHLRTISDEPEIDYVHRLRAIELPETGTTEWRGSYAATERAISQQVILAMRSSESLYDLGETISYGVRKQPWHVYDERTTYKALPVLKPVYPEKFEDDDDVGQDAPKRRLA